MRARGASSARARSTTLRARLAGNAGVADVRGRGLLLAIECDAPELAPRACARALARGVIVLPSGDDGRVLALTPPLSIEREACSTPRSSCSWRRCADASGGADPGARRARRARARLDARARVASRTTRASRRSRSSSSRSSSRTARPYRRFCEGARPHARERRELARDPAGADGRLQGARAAPASRPSARCTRFRTSGTATQRARRAAPRHARALRGVAAARASGATCCRICAPARARGSSCSRRRPTRRPTRRSRTCSASCCASSATRRAASSCSGGALAGDALLARARRGVRGRHARRAVRHRLRVRAPARRARARGVARWRCRPARARMETGGFKGRARERSRDELYAEIEARLGIPPARIVNQYGMTELGSQFYDSVLREPERAAPQARAALDARAHRRSAARRAAGRRARRRDRRQDLANTGSVLAIQTADLGARDGDGFEVLGREPGAEAARLLDRAGRAARGRRVTPDGGPRAARRAARGGRAPARAAGRAPRTRRSRARSTTGATRPRRGGASSRRSCRRPRASRPRRVREGLALALADWNGDGAARAAARELGARRAARARRDPRLRHDRRRAGRLAADADAASRSSRRCCCARRCSPSPRRAIPVSAELVARSLAEVDAELGACVALAPIAGARRGGARRAARGRLRGRLRRRRDGRVARGARRRRRGASSRTAIASRSPCSAPTRSRGDALRDARRGARARRRTLGPARLPVADRGLRRGRRGDAATRRRGARGRAGRRGTALAARQRRAAPPRRSRTSARRGASCAPRPARRCRVHAGCARRVVRRARERRAAASALRCIASCASTRSTTRRARRRRSRRCGAISRASRSRASARGSRRSRARSRRSAPRASARRAACRRRPSTGRTSGRGVLLPLARSRASSCRDRAPHRALDRTGSRIEIAVRIHLVTPRNPPSFWTYDEILPTLGKRCIFPNLSMPTLAGLTPRGARGRALRRERRGDRLRRRRRHRRRHRLHHPQAAHARDPRRVAPARALRGGRRSLRVAVSGGAARALRRALRRRGRGDLAALPARLRGRAAGRPSTAPRSCRSLARRRCRASICCRSTATTR